MSTPQVTDATSKQSLVLYIDEAAHRAGYLAGYRGQAAAPPHEQGTRDYYSWVWGYIEGQGKARDGVKPTPHRPCANAS